MVKIRLLVIKLIFSLALGCDPKGQAFANSDRSVNQDLIQETIKLIKDGDTKILLPPDSHDFILLVGNTGAGKSTMAKLMSAPKDLQVYSSSSEDRFLIKDRVGNGISEGSTAVSKTIFPELQRLKEDRGVVLVDMPGYSDTRRASIEIANAWFIKKVASHAQRVKILFVVNYSSLRKGENRGDFKSVLEHGIQFLKEPSKFKPGLGLIVTKVESSMNKTRIVAGVASFLAEFIRDLPQVFTDPFEQGLASALIQGLLQQIGDKDYAKIAIFPQPEQEGLLSAIPEAMAARKDILDLALKKSKFVPSTRNDFGFSVSPAAKQLLQEIGETLNGKITESVRPVGAKLKDSLAQKIQQVPENSLGALLDQSQKFDAIGAVLEKATTRQGFLRSLDAIAKPMVMPQGASDFDNLQAIDGYLTFFEEITLQSIQPMGMLWTAPILEAFQITKITIFKKAGELNSGVHNRTLRAAAEIREKIKQKQTSSNNKAQLVLEFQTIIGNLEAFSQEASQSRTYNEVALKFRGILGKFQVSDSQFQDLSPDVVLKPTHCSFTFDLFLWLKPFEKLTEFVREKRTQVEGQIKEESHKAVVQKLNREIALVRTDFEQKSKTKVREVNNLKAKMEQSKAETTKAIKTLEASHKQALEQVQSSRRAEIANLNTELNRLKSFHKQALEQVQSSHQTELANLNAELNRLKVAQQQTQQQNSKPYCIETRKFWRYLSLSGNTPTTTKTSGGACDSHKDWKLVPISGGYFLIQHANRNKVLGVQNTGSKVSYSDTNYKLVTSDYSSSLLQDSLYQWAKESVSSGSSTYSRFKNRYIGYLLDANDNGNVYLHTDNGGDFQHWVVKN